VREQQRHRLRCHRRPMVSMERELARRDPLSPAALLDQLSRQGRAFLVSDHPANDVPAEDVQDHVEVEVGPLRRPEQLGDVPAPHLVGSRRQELGGRGVRMAQLIPPLTHLVILVEDPVHRPLRAEIALGIEKLCVHLRRSQIDELRFVQHLEHGGPLRRGQRPRRTRPLPGRRLGLASAVVGRRGQTEHCARRRDPKPRPHLPHRLDHHFSLSNGVPSNAATFFWTSTNASARSARFCHRAISRSCSAIFLSRGSGGATFGPRFFGDSPSSSPRSRAARQVTRCEEYSPSRRSSAPISPGFVHRSASRTIRRLYSAVNRRRSAFATTSTSGLSAPGAAPAVGAPAGKTPVALRAPSVSPALSITSPLAFFSTTFIHLCLPALYIKLSPPDCLTLVGREGLLERRKRQPASFGSVLRELHEATGRFEASFASKLVATIRPDTPVIDSVV